MELIVNDMTCGHCQSLVTKAIKGVDGQAKINVDLASRLVQIDTSADLDEVQAALAEAGYPATEKA
jgi:copper chaperone CopZ